MDIVDMQLHEFAPFEDWPDVTAPQRRRVLTEAMLQALDCVGVTAAVINPIEDPEWADELVSQFPERFATVVNLGRASDGRGIDVDSPELEDDIVAAKQRGAVGVRIGFFGESSEAAAEFAGGSLDRGLAMCEKHEMPLFMFCSGRLDLIERPADAFPGLQLIIDHIGMPQPPYEQPDSPPWKALPELLALSRFPNVAIKMCGPIVFSGGSYPFSDVWPPVAQIIEAYGPDRVAWASDNGRFRGRIGWTIRHPVAAEHDYPGKHTYMESLAFFLYNDELDQDEKEQILGRTARRLLKWPPPPG
ncbi:MAG: amidohydrolase family protein [Jiangellaceae bacterium]